ncbi:MAG: DUF4445 domain-containing protein [Desulfovibrio sp.]|nr:DUF4445 domain-containing protein [Desulfovibrio sp.]
MLIHLLLPSTAQPDDRHAKGFTISTMPGQRLSQAIWLSGLVPPLPLCGGLGRCGRCRVRFTGIAPQPLPEEKEALSPRELTEGWRLACHHNAHDGVEGITLELPPTSLFPGRMTETMPQDLCQAEAFLPELTLAVDLGTTSVCWRARHADTAALLAQGSDLNPQAGAGADVISRLAVAQRPDGRRRLAQLVWNYLKNVIAGLRHQGLGHVTGICLAANTAMTDIFCDRDIRGLCAAPYKLSHHGDETVSLPGLPPVYIPPLPAPFVGGDASAGLFSLLATGAPRPLVLADLGTNGELALLTHEDQLWLTSVPLGPALEGIGPECGQLAGPGVITAFCLEPAGLQAIFHPYTDAKMATDMRTQAQGISATGYLSLLAILLRTGVLDSDGHFVTTVSMPLARRLIKLMHPGTGEHPPCLHLPHGLWLSAADVEDMLKVKAAFALALNVLLNQANCRATDVASFFLAGALGKHASSGDLVTLGLIPPAMEQHLHIIGNASLDGADLLIQNIDKRDLLTRLCARAHVLSLVDDPHFHKNYLRQMRFGA